MNNLENSIKDCISKELEKGIIEKVIAGQLEKCIEKSISDMFSWSGDIKKVIEEKVKSVMIPYLENYDYSEYITKLDYVLVEVLKSSALENKKLINNFTELMTESPKEIKMSEILKAWSEYCEKEIDKDKIEMDYEGVYLTTSFDTEKINNSWSSYDRYLVTFECEEDEELKCECEIECWKESRNEKYTLRYKGPRDINSLRYLNEFEVFLMKISQGYDNVILDVESDTEEIFIEYQY